jgi:hypothetical protein
MLVPRQPWTAAGTVDVLIVEVDTDEARRSRDLTSSSATP